MRAIGRENPIQPSGRRLGIAAGVLFVISRIIVFVGPCPTFRI